MVQDGSTRVYDRLQRVRSLLHPAGNLGRRAGVQTQVRLDSLPCLNDDSHGAASQMPLRIILDYTRPPCPSPCGTVHSHALGLQSQPACSTYVVALLCAQDVDKEPPEHV